MQDSSVVHLESLLINQYIPEIKKHHTSVSALTCMVPFRQQNRTQIKPPFPFEQAAGCREPKPEQRQNVYLGKHLCFLNCRKKRITLNKQWFCSCNNKSKCDRTHEFIPKNKASTDDRIIPHLN